MTFSNQLSKLRKRKNITQIELASMLKVKQYVISSWETGRSEPSINQIIQLSEIFDVPTDYLLGKSFIMAVSEDDFKKVIENIKQDSTNDFLNCIKELCDDMTEKKKEKILNIVKELADL